MPNALETPEAEDDPLLEAHVQRALWPYLDLLPPEDLARLRETMLDFLKTHPIAAPVMQRLRVRMPPDESGNQKVYSPEEYLAGAQKSRQAKGGGS